MLRSLSLSVSLLALENQAQTTGRHNTPGEG